MRHGLGFVDGRLMAMIFAMLAVGEGLDRSGAVELIVTNVRPLMEGLPPFGMILAVYLLGVILTEFLSNNAVAVIYTPIAIELAQRRPIHCRQAFTQCLIQKDIAFDAEYTLNADRKFATLARVMNFRTLR